MYDIVTQPAHHKDIINANEQLVLSTTNVPSREDWLKLALVNDKKRKTIVVPTDNNSPAFFKSYGQKEVRYKSILSLAELKQLALDKFNIVIEDDVVAEFFPVDNLSLKTTQ